MKRGHRGGEIQRAGLGRFKRASSLKVIEAARFVRSIAEGQPHGATLADAVHSAQALDAMLASVESGAWVRL